MDYRKTVEHLREKSEIFKKSNYAVDGVVKCFEESADTIEQLAEELKAYKDKQEQGLLISLPCKVGDKLYQIKNDELYELILIGLVYDEANKEWLLELAVQIGLEWHKIIRTKERIGTTIFLTRSEAEEALAKMGGK